MSKLGYISRYIFILKKLKSNQYTAFEEMDAYINKQFEYMQMHDEEIQPAFSKRTFQRDVKEIKNLFGIDIDYSKSQKGYFISHNESFDRTTQNMVEAFDMFNSLNLAQDLAPLVHLEKRKPQGTENLYGILHAIKNKKQIKFTYQNFYEEHASHRLVDPYVLKEFKNRWYIIANDSKDGHLKSFALDRLSQFEVTNYPYQNSALPNLEHIYKNCFGIVSPNQAAPDDIILSFEAHQGKYIKTLPLHETQEILIDNEDELRITIKVYPTHDLVMELLSYGDKMKVIQPQSLADNIQGILASALKQYKK